MRKHTQIRYGYEDLKGVKADGIVIVKGWNDRVIPFVWKTVEDGKYFIPQEIGFPPLYKMPNWAGPDDHVWHELLAIDQVEEEPTLDMHIEQVITAFAQAAFDEDGWAEKLGIESRYNPLREYMWALFQEMEKSGDSQAAGVADILKTIAENGEGQEEPAFLVGCAAEVRDAAQYFIEQVEAKKMGDKEVKIVVCWEDGQFEEVTVSIPASTKPENADKTSSRAFISGLSDPQTAEKIIAVYVMQDGRDED